MQMLNDLIELTNACMQFIYEHWAFVIVVVAVYIGWLLHRKG